MKRSVHGVTLIEMMVVVAIMGILAGIWARASTARQVRNLHHKQLMEALITSNRPRMAVIEHYVAEGEFPLDNEAAGLPSPEVLAGIAADRVEIDSGAIHIVLKKKSDTAETKVLSLRPAILEAEPYGPNLYWVCGNQNADPKLITIGNNRTNVLNEYLPPQCRGTGTTGVEAPVR